MADISKITMPSGTTYDIKDATARELIEELEGYSSFLGVTTTELTDGATTNPITVNGQSVTAKAGSIATYGSKEFIFNGNAWQEFGDLSGLGSLAFKNSATGSITPSGTVSAPTITVSGTLPSFTATVTNEVLTFGWNAGALPTATSSQPTFTGTSGNVTVS